MPFHTGTEAAFGRQYYVFMQYSRFVRHGYTILESPLPELALVAASPRGDARQTFVVVVTNPLPREEVRPQSIRLLSTVSCLSALQPVNTLQQQPKALHRSSLRTLAHLCCITAKSDIVKAIFY